jgi:phosphoserine phosphatase RsbU/P
MGRTTIFNQLVINIVLPVMAVLMLLAFLNYQHTADILREQNENKNKDISRDVKNILKFQDYSLQHIESGLDRRMKEISQAIIDYIKTHPNVQEVDLDKIRTELEMDFSLEDIYIIDSLGVVLNTTFKEDTGLNVYNFGENYKNLLEKIRKTGDLHLERFSVEAATNKLKKYSYQATHDRKYLVELGFYSHNANNVIEQFKTEINSLANENESIRQVDFFIGDENPVSYNENAKIQESHLKTYRNALQGQRNTQQIEYEDGKKLYYEYIYITRSKSDLYKTAIIRLISDRSADDKVLRDELITFLIVFGFTILLLLGIILRRSKTITLPIINLVDKANRIKSGDLSERVDVMGNNEITTLSESFNLMLEKLEESYTGLEQKVLDRTVEIRKQNEHIQEQNRKITDSILYAKRIQTAILPSDKELNELLHENFVLFKPMTIVSGDFYWITKKENKVLVSAADCTGHGVPGAFMSMIGNTLLNKIVNENNITQPHNILHQLREEIIESLNQAKDDNLSKDGMDMTICAIDFKKLKVEFSGANNPLIIARNGEIIEYKGNKQPVGMQAGKLEPFTNHEIDIQKNDVLYLFSDGFQDQFGGIDGKKFMKKRFKELLSEIYAKSMEDQHNILDNTISTWIKDTRQIDDILVMGIRI